MNSISIRTRDEISFDRKSHYVNLRAVKVDGKVVYNLCEPVYPSLADEYSVTINALTRRPASGMKKRLNVDALDLEDSISKIS